MPTQPTELLEIDHVISWVPTHTKGFFDGGGMAAVETNDEMTVGEIKTALIAKRYADLNPPPSEDPPEP